MRIVSFSFIIIFLTSCGVSNNPKVVAEHFIMASLNMDFKEAKKYATPETVKMLDFVQNIVAKTKIKRSGMKNIKIQIEEEIITGDNASVKYKKEAEAKEYIINLKSIGGKWLVDAGIDDISKGSDAEAGEMDETPDK